jgi:hypothetical protein
LLGNFLNKFECDFWKIEKLENQYFYGPVFPATIRETHAASNGKSIERISKQKGEKLR